MRVPPQTGWLCASALIFAAVHAAGAEIEANRLFKSLDANSDGKLAKKEAGDKHRLLFSRMVRTGDEDGDGLLSAEEFQAALEPLRAEKAGVEKQGSRTPGADALVVMLARMDVDGDSQLEAAEIPQDYQDVYERMLGPADDDKDGKLNSREIARGGPRLGMIAQMAAARMQIDVEAAAANLPASKRAAVERMDAYPRPEAMMADPEQAAQFFKRLDANGDKRLTADEAPEQFAGRFEEMLRRGDQNGDKQLNKREFEEIGRRAAAFQNFKPDPAAAGRMVRQMLGRFDRDDDGQLSQEEAPPRLAEAFDRADADGDGQLDRTELTAVAENMSRMGRMARGGDQAAPDAAESKQTDNRSRKARRSKKGGESE